MLFLHSWCRRWRILVNETKTKVIHFRCASVPRTASEFSCGQLPILIADSYKYLGLHLNEHLDMQHTIAELAKSASRALCALQSKFSFAGGMTFEVFDRLYKALVEPVMYYGSAIWGTLNCAKLDAVQARACKFFLGIRKNTSNIAARGELGWLSNKSNVKIEILRHWNKLCSSDNDRLISRIHNWSLTRGRSWEKRVINIIRELDLIQLQNGSVNIDSAREAIAARDALEWTTALWNDTNKVNGNKLRTYRIFKQSLTAETYIKHPFITRQQRRSIAAIRCGSSSLKIETGRYAKPPLLLNERLCTYCNNGAIEDEKHFILHCTFYSELRKELFDRAKDLLLNFYDLSDNDKLLFLMNEENLARHVASTVHKMYCKRNFTVSL